MLHLTDLATSNETVVVS